ncbi:MAG: serine/threonine-protein phosphatase [Candidatus Dadabacteria bacterium]|nr:MAG: serine/threonine-protein phosphatase [Candidatus Dadabacteria bacterium]
MALFERGREGLEHSQSNSQREEVLMPAAVTDAGCERTLNEDRYAVIESPSGVLWLVCDGMGGEMGGELAAQLALDAIKRDLESYPARPCAQALRSALLEANRVIVLRRQNPAFQHMGTTIVAAMFSGNELCIASVGDSRAYLVSNGEAVQLTVDHTYVQQLVDNGELHPDEALSHPQAHVLTRCIGAEPALKIDINTYYIWPPEGQETTFLLLCSDGLYSLVSQKEIGEAVSTLSPQKACAHLVELAKQRGGFDNITIAIIPIKGSVRTYPPQELKTSLTNSQELINSWGIETAQGEEGDSLLRDAAIGVLVSLVAVLGVILVVFLKLSGKI